MTRMDTYYEIEHKENGVLKITASGDSYTIFRIPYNLLQSKNHGVNLTVEQRSDFIVYLLSGKTKDGENALYVGTSTTGIDKRPVEHEDKGIAWDQCIIFTAEEKDLSESTILHIEDRIRKLIDGCSKRYVNVTRQTKGRSANKKQQDLADRKFIPAIIEVYDILGFDLHPVRKTDLRSFIETESEEVIPQVIKGNYDNLKLTGEMKEWLAIADSIVLKIDPGVITKVKKVYATHSYGKVFAYWYPLVRENKFRVLLRGTAQDYDDPRVIPREEKVHNGDCKAVFYVTCENDLKCYGKFVKIAMQKSKS